MLIIVDHKISSGAKKRLSRFGELMEIRTEGITYPAISGHPDIFFCQSPAHLFLAPNLPENYFKILDDHQIKYIKGELPVGQGYPATSRYNAVATDKYLIHNFRHTEPVIRDSIPFCRDSIPVACSSTFARLQVEQGYTRCNLLPLKDGHFITSDPGIYKVLQGLRPYPHLQGLHPSPQGLRPSPQGLHPGSQGLHPSPQGLHPCCLLVNPHKINLECFPHGFFGGCCGVFDNVVFINGSLLHHPDGGNIREYLESLNYEIVELDEGPLRDVGSILFA